MISMTAGAVVRAFQEYDPNEEVLIGWWDKECLEPEFVEEDESGNTTPLPKEMADSVWAGVMSSVEGQFDRDAEYIYESLANVVADEIQAYKDEYKEEN